MKHFKKIAIFLLLVLTFIIFLFWLDKREIKKEPFVPSKFETENLEQNKKILHNSKLYNSEYRKYLQQKIEKEKEAKEQEQEQEYQEEEERETDRVKSKKEKVEKVEKVKDKKSKSKKSKKTKKVKEDDGKIKEKTKIARIQREKENNKNDKYIFKKKMKSKKRP